MTLNPLIETITDASCFGSKKSVYRADVIKLAKHAFDQYTMIKSPESHKQLQAIMSKLSRKEESAMIRYEKAHFKAMKA